MRFKLAGHGRHRAWILGLALAFANLCAAAASAQDNLSPGARATRDAVLTAAAASPAADGWRTDTLADGQVAAIGKGVVDGMSQIVGLTCGATKRPELFIAVPGSGKAARTLTVESSDMKIALPFSPLGNEAAAGDALLAGLFGPDDAKFRIAVDNRPFPSSGAREAFERVEKDCEQRSGWRYGNDDERQLVWISPIPDRGAPQLTFGKPATGWVMAALSCDRTAKALIVKSTGFPKRSRSGRTLPLVFHIDGHKYTATGRVTRFDGGDVPGLLIANFRRPQKLLNELQLATAATLQSGGNRISIGAEGLAPLLPQFRASCGLPAR